MYEEHFILQYQHSGTFANRKYEEISYPKNQKNVPPHSSNSIEKMQPHYSQSSREKKTLHSEKLTVALSALLLLSYGVLEINIRYFK